MTDSREDPCGSIKDTDKCQRCKHPSSWHRHSDEGCLSTHPQPCYPEIAPFRCIGYDCEKDGNYPGGTPETRCGCPDFVQEGEDARWPK